MKRTVPVVVGVLFVLAVSAWTEQTIPGNVVSLFQKRCAVCHKGKTPPQGLSFEPTQIAAAIDAPSREMPDLKIIDTAAPEASYILKKVRRESGIKGKPMPPPKALEADELKVLETWVLGLEKFPVPASATSTSGSDSIFSGHSSDPVHLSWKRTVTVKTTETALPSMTSGS